MKKSGLRNRTRQMSCVVQFTPKKSLGLRGKKKCTEANCSQSTVHKSGHKFNTFSRVAFHNKVLKNAISKKKRVSKVTGKRFITVI